jgi:hypothetical protein
MRFATVVATAPSIPSAATSLVASFIARPRRCVFICAFGFATAFELATHAPGEQRYSTRVTLGSCKKRVRARVQE